MNTSKLEWFIFIMGKDCDFRAGGTEVLYAVWINIGFQVVGSQVDVTCCCNSTTEGRRIDHDLRMLKLTELWKRWKARERENKMLRRSFAGQNPSFCHVN